MKKARKTHKQSTYKFLFSLVAMLGFVIFLKNLPPFVQQVEPKKVFATHEVKSDFLNFATTVSQQGDKQEATNLPLFSLASLISLTPTPATESKETLGTTSQNDFCLDVSIFMYHHVQPIEIAAKLGHAQLTVDSNTFDEQIAQLFSDGYTMISSEEVVNALRLHQQLPAKSMVITLDDGYDDAYDYAYPIAKKYNIKMDLMIPTGLINNAGYMTWDQLREISHNPLFKIYNHTWSHTALGGVDKDTIVREVSQANKQLEEQLGVKNPIIVYPYGSFSPLAIATLQELGFIAGLSTIQGTHQCVSTIMELQRTRIGNAPLSFYGF